MEVKNHPSSPLRVRILAEAPSQKAMAEALLCPPFLPADDLPGEELLLCFDRSASPAAAAAALRRAHPGVPLMLLSPHFSRPEAPAGGVRLLPEPCPFALLRETALALASPEPAHPAGLTLDPTRRMLLGGGIGVPLTEKEAALVAVLLETPGKAVSAETLTARLWPDSSGGKNACRVAVSYLRRKLDGAFGAGLLLSVRGRGYLLKSR